MVNILKYSNGWGHLIISIICLAIGVYLYASGTPGVGLGLIATVSSAWFIPGAARQVVDEVRKTSPLQPSAVIVHTGMPGETPQVPAVPATVLVVPPTQTPQNGPTT